VISLCSFTVSQVEPYSDEVMAASKIVGAAKVKLATTQASAARDWHVLNALENSDEHMQLNVSRLMRHHVLGVFGNRDVALAGWVVVLFCLSCGSV
jgi:hypothetical protein